MSAPALPSLRLSLDRFTLLSIASRLVMLAAAVVAAIALAASQAPETVAQNPVPAYDAAVSSDGPVGFWKFDETSGFNLADASGNGHDGSLYGISGQPNISGAFPGSPGSVFLHGSYQFAGVSSVGPAELPPTNLSMELWFRDRPQTTGKQYLAYMGNVESSSPNSDFVGLWIDHDAEETGPGYRVGFGTFDGSKHYVSGVYRRNEWHHVVGTISGGVEKLYIDGEQVDQGAAGAPSIQSNLVFGTASSAPEDHFLGNLDNAAVYDHALTAAAVTAHYNGSELPPSNSVLPGLSGVPAAGHTLTATHGIFAGPGPMTYAYQWENCDNTGSQCTDIDGATGQDYVVDSQVIGTLRVAVTATNQFGSDTASSKPQSVLAGYDAAVASDGPVGYWRFDEWLGSVAADSTTNGNDGTYAGSPSLFETGAFTRSASVQLDGSSQHIDTSAVGPSALPPGHLSLEAWFKDDPSKTGKQYVAYMGNYDQSGPDSDFVGIWIDHDAPELGAGDRVAFGTSDGSQHYVSGGYERDKWHHVVGTIANGVETLYLDGAQVDQGPAGNPSIHSGLVWGSATASSPEHFKGNLDDAAAYDRALTPTEIEHHYAIGNAPVVPVNVSLPVISGTPRVARPLTASHGSWFAGGDPLDYAYRWQRCDENGNNCADIPGETTDSLVLRAADAYSTVRVVVTATSRGGSTAASSDQIGPMAPDGLNGQYTPPAAAPAQGVAYDDAVTASDPLAYYKLDEAPGASGAEDSTGHGYSLAKDGSVEFGRDGVFTSSLAAGFGAGALYRPGFDYRDDFAMEAWIKPDMPSGQADFLANGCTCGGFWQGTFFGDYNNSLYGMISTPGTNNVVQEDDPLGSGWHHVVLERDAGTTSIWLDGVKESHTTSAAPGGGGWQFALGVRPGWGLNFNGSIDNVAFYAHPLSAAEIANHFSTGEDVAAPATTTLPTVSGDNFVSGTVTASQGDWSDHSPPTYQWRRCNADGDSCVPIDGATSATYDLVAADEGATLRVTVLHANRFGETWRSSDAWGPIVRNQASDYAAAVAADQPAGYWRLDDPVGAVVARDSVGDRNLTITGGVTPGADGALPGSHAMTFAGGHLEGPGFDRADDFAMEAWIKPDMPSGQADFLANGCTCGGFWQGTFFGDYNNSLYGMISTPGTNNVVQEDDPLGSGWHHVVLERDAGTTSIWLDGVKESQTTSAAPGGSGWQFALGYRPGYGLNFNGSIDNAAFYDHALSAARIQAHFDAASGGPAAAPSNTVAPAISGSTEVGAELNVSDGTWDGTPTSYAYQWLRCDADGAACAEIAGATGKAYRLTRNDADTTIRARVTATGAGGEGTATSDATGAIHYAGYIGGVLADSPAAYWPLDDASGTTAADLSGNGRDGTYGTGIELAQAGGFAGSGDSARFPGGATLDTPLSLADIGGDLTDTSYELWFKPETVTSGNQALLYLGNYDRAGPIWHGVGLMWHNQSLEAWSYDGSVDHIAGRQLALGEWHHAALVVTGGEVRLYVDGVLAGTTPLGTPSIAAGQTVRIGATYGDADSFTGSMQHVAVFDHALTADQVQAHYDGARIAPSSLSKPTVTGTPRSGQTLTAQPGSWSGAHPISYAYQWRRCDSDGANCADLAGATSATYTATAADTAATLRVAVTATNATGSATAVSGPTLPADSYASMLAGEGAVAYWPLADATGTTAADASGNGHDGTYGAGAELGQPGAFAGAGHSVRLPGGTTIDTPVTMQMLGGDAADTSYELWFKPETVSSAMETLLYLGNYDRAGPIWNGIGLFWQNQQVELWSYDGSADHITAAPATIGEWHHVAAVATGGELRLYLDGEPAGTAPLGSPSIAALQTVRLGATYDGALSYTGGLQHAAVYDRALSAAEVKAHFDASSGAPAGPPVNTTPPAVSGSAVAGSTLTATDGDWSGAPATFSHRWQRCEPGTANCVDISGATSATYTPVDDDIGSVLVAVVTASNGAGTVEVHSAPTGVVQPAPPTSTGGPVIEGIAREGEALHAAPGTWTGSSLAFSYQWRRCAADGTACADIASADGQDYTATADDVWHTLVVSVTAINAGGAATATSASTGVVSPDAGGPTAPPLESGSTTSTKDATSFLYTGAAPIQTGVSAGSIGPERAAVLRGYVFTPDGAPLPGVRVSVVGHPEFGSTTTTGDGGLYMAVAGGGSMRVRYEKDGYLPAERDVDVPWQDYAWIKNVALVPYDTHASTVDLTNGVAPMQVAQGSPVTDDDGTRQATLLFNQGTTASMTLPDGTQQPLTTLHVRATEFTVGAGGPTAMPASLPSTSAYTYAVDFSVDEARAAGATHVDFSQPVTSYTDNFLGFPVGATVPVGYYDPQQGAWAPSQSGVVVKVLSTAGGTAQLAVDASGQPATAAQLAQLGIGDAELQELAQTHQAGDSLWRVQLTHFTEYDYNSPPAPPNGARAPTDGSPNNQPVSNPCETGGSIIQCENQTLGEEAAVAGTSETLHYASDRTPGRAAARTLDITVTPPDPPASLKQARVEVSVAGRLFSKFFTADPGQHWEFQWDGKDAFGRVVHGTAPVTVKTGYVYPIAYGPATRFADSATSDVVYTGVRHGVFITSGSAGTGEVRAPTGLPEDDGGRTTIWRQYETSIGAPDARDVGLGGWDLTEHQSYDPRSRTLYSGDGTQRNASDAGSVLTRLAGSNDLPSMYVGSGVTSGPDGSVYFSDPTHGQVYKRAPDGTLSLVAGAGGGGAYAGDGGPAVAARLWAPWDLAMGPDGSLYIADQGNNVVRRVAPDGIISTVAGNGTHGFSGDGGPATQAQLYQPTGLDVGPDGSVYIADWMNSRVRKVDASGTITTVMGGGMCAQNLGTSCLSQSAYLNRVNDVALAPDGTLWASSENYAGGTMLWRRDPDGKTSWFVAASGYPNHTNASGVPLSRANIETSWITAGPDGSIYYSDRLQGTVRKIDPAGTVTTIAGGAAGCPSYHATDVPATKTCLNMPYGLTRMPDGGIAFLDYGNTTIYKVGGAAPGYNGSDIKIPSQDGSELYRFDKNGRHLATIDTATRAALETFAYDSAGRLSAVTDGDGNVTRVERDASGKPTAIVAPFGQRTSLHVDANGYLDQISDPAGRAVQLDTSADGLLHSLTDPNGHTSVFGFDAQGLLTNDADAAGGSKTLSRSGDNSNYEVTISTALGRTVKHRVEHLADGSLRRTGTGPDGLQSTTTLKPDNSQTSTLADGSTTSVQRGGDPRFGAQSPFVQQATLITPSGLQYKQQGTSTAVVSDASNPLSATSLTATSTVGGNTWSSTYNYAASSVTDREPSGRTQTTTVDRLGRPLTASAPGLAPVTSTYDTSGRLAQVQQGSRTWTYVYDTSGRPSEVHAPLGKVTSYGYDAADRLTSVTLPDGRQIGYSYDAAGNLTGVTPPGRVGHGFSFSPVDLPSSYAPPATGDGGVPTTFAYNADKQITSVSRPDGTSISFAYDAAGRTHTATADNGDAKTLGYDAQSGQLSSVSGTTGEDLSFQHDGPLATRDSLAGTIHGDVVRTFDNNFRLASLAVAGTSAIPYGYDQDGLLTQVGGMSVARTAATGFVSGTALGAAGTSRTYDSYGTPTVTSSTYGGTQLLGESLNTDDLGRIASKTETVNGTATAYGYTYDSAGHLTDVSKDGQPAAHYGYDDNGNRTSKTVGDATLNATYDAQDRLTAYGQKAYTYTRNGELKTKTETVGGDVTTYAYDGFGELNRVDLPGGSRIDYVLDAAGRRVGKKVDGQLTQGFVYGSGINPLAELDASGSVRSVFVYGADGTTASYMLRDGNTYRIFSDERGSVRTVVDVATGDIAQRLAYDEFGNVTEDTNPGFQPFGYAGGLYDGQTKLTRFGARDYDAETGRFTTKDPLGFGGGDTNLYGYGLDDPINTVDPAGTSFFDDVSNMAAGILDGATGGLSTKLAGALLDFNPDCADFGKWGHVGQGIGLVGSMFFGGGEASIGIHAAEDASAAAKGVGAAEHAIPIGPVAEKPWNVLDRLAQKGANFPGYKGGRVFENRGPGMRLPESGPNGPITYREWDVNPHTKGVDRGGERLVTGSDGSAYYTTDHYESFTRFR